MEFSHKEPQLLIVYSGWVVDSCLHRNDNTIRYWLFFLIHLNRKTSRIFSVNRIPKRCVLDLNSIRFKSFVVGLAGDLPNNVNKLAASKLSNEFILVRTRILVKCHHYSLTRSCSGKSICHSRESGNPAFSLWTPAFAGVTSSVFVFRNRY